MVVSPLVEPGKRGFPAVRVEGDTSSKDGLWPEQPLLDGKLPALSFLSGRLLWGSSELEAAPETAPGISETGLDA